MSKIRIRDFVAIDARLALLQSTWSEGAMQSIGLAYSLVPGLSRLYPDEKELKKTLKRYNAPINTHPFLASVIAGSVLKFEEQSVPARTIDTFRRTAMGPLAALGDPFFDGALGPLIAVFSVLLALTVSPIAGAVSIVVLATGIQSAGRIAGLWIGYTDPENALTRLAKILNSARTKSFRFAAALGAGAIPALLASKFESTIDGWTAAILWVIAVALTVVLKRKRRAIAYVSPALLAAWVLLEVLI